MKKKLIFALCAVLCLIPIAILVLQAIKTQIPDVFLADKQVNYAYYEWTVTDHDGNTIRTKKSDEDLQKAFEKAELIILDNFDSLKELNFEAEPIATSVTIYDLTTNETKAQMNYGAYLASTYQGESGHNYQVVLLLKFQLMKNVTTVAAYSFEVQIP